MGTWVELWRSIENGLTGMLRGVAYHEYENASQAFRQLNIQEVTQRIGTVVWRVVQWANSNPDITIATWKQNIKSGRLTELHKADPILTELDKADPFLTELARASLGVTETSTLSVLESQCHEELQQLRARNWTRCSRRSLGYLDVREGSLDYLQGQRWDGLVGSVPDEMCKALRTTEVELQQRLQQANDSSTNPELEMLRAEVKRRRQDLVLYWEGRWYLWQYLTSGCGTRSDFVTTDPGSTPGWKALCEELQMNNKKWDVYYALDRLPAERVIALGR